MVQVQLIASTQSVPAQRPAIALSGISKIYGSGNTEVRALDGVDLMIGPGEYCAIMGTSGSGKSTLMNVMGCLDQPTAGQYLLDGVNVAHLNEKQLALIRNRKIGFVFQQFHLLSQLSALENVMLPMIYGGTSGRERRSRAKVALEQVGLGDRLNNRPNQLSGGQQQRVAIARAIVNQPVVLLADEPTGALDTATTAEVMEIFQRLNHQGITVILVTHEPEVAAQTNRTVCFRDGRIIQDTPNEAG
ncbi:MAG: ABC transporter ATP-binding protein [Cyanobacteria bacterium P01_D01_bin.73]